MQGPQNTHDSNGDVGQAAPSGPSEQIQEAAPQLQGSGGGIWPPMRTAVGTGGPGDEGGAGGKGVPPGDQFGGWGLDWGELPWEGDLKELLVQIKMAVGADLYQGCLVVGHDGIVVQSDGLSAQEAESLGVWALGAYMHSEHVVKKMGHDRVHMIRAVTPLVTFHIADFGGGLLLLAHK